MVIDFFDIDSVVNPLIEKHLDHKWLNDSLATDSPSVEFIAKWIFDYLSPLLSGLHAIKVYETPTCSATYQC